jgi:glyoxylase-like metal-dependent hydrolase (beta-lactamase superfamily II)
MIQQPRPEVTGFFHEDTNSVAHVCAGPGTRRCAQIAPVLDSDRNTRTTYTDFADRMIGFVRERQLELEWILDTHPHAGHFSAAPYLKEKLGTPLAIGSHRAADLEGDLQPSGLPGRQIATPVQQTRHLRQPRENRPHTGRPLIRCSTSAA